MSLYYKGWGIIWNAKDKERWIWSIKIKQKFRLLRKQVLPHHSVYNCNVSFMV